MVGLVSLTCISIVYIVGAVIRADIIPKCCVIFNHCQLRLPVVKRT